KLGAVSQKRAAVQAFKEARDHRARHERQIIHGREQAGIKFQGVGHDEAWQLTEESGYNGADRDSPRATSCPHCVPVRMYSAWCSPASLLDIRLRARFWSEQTVSNLRSGLRSN